MDEFTDTVPVPPSAPSAADELTEYEPDDALDAARGILVSLAIGAGAIAGALVMAVAWGW